MKTIKVDTVFCGVPMTLVDNDYCLSRRPPKSDEVEMTDIMIDDVSISPLIDGDDWDILADRLFEAANEDFHAATEDYADNLRDDRRFG